MTHYSTHWIPSLLIAAVGCSHIPGLGTSAPATPVSASSESPTKEEATERTATSGGSTDAPACSGIKDTRKDVDFNDILRSDGERYPNVRARRHALVMEAGRGDFVAAIADVTENDLSTSVYTKNPEIVLKKGEPLLRLACSDYYATHEVMTLSLRHIRAVPMKLIDAKPKTFVVPEAPALWEFDAHLAYVAASPEDLEAIPGATESAKLEDQCAAKALDACASASSKVKAAPWRPDTDAKADKACEIAKVRERNKCMGGVAGKRFEHNAKQLDDRRRRRELADFKALAAKFSGVAAR